MKYIRFAQHILSVIFWTLLMFGFDSSRMAILTLLSALLHELGHLLILNSIDSSVFYLPKGRIYGFRIIPSPCISYKEELSTSYFLPLLSVLRNV